MPGPLSLRPHRTKGSWIPRLVGAGFVVLAACIGLAGYLSTARTPGPAHRRSPAAALPARVVKAQAVGVIDFGPDDDRDAFANDPDDHPLMLQLSGTTIDFVNIPPSALAGGVPQWTANQMSDGSDIFVYVPTGTCLNSSAADKLRLSHCDLALGQRWRPLNQAVTVGQAVAQFANARTGLCLTAGKTAGPAMLAACGPRLTKTQEIAFWWSA
ncbi:MAG TPA: hypothetical protein VNF47_18880 [Streptosporangiaceae bacterium]|nr:hypothetical protein [Streptosporangiaceae bacterium]